MKKKRNVELKKKNFENVSYIIFLAKQAYELNLCKKKKNYVIFPISELKRDPTLKKHVMEKEQKLEHIKKKKLKKKIIYEMKIYLKKVVCKLFCLYNLIFEKIYIILKTCKNQY